MILPVSSAKAQALLERMQTLGVQEEDWEESFVRSGGKGGQNVNKVATCVVLVHKPSGLTVKCQIERSQGMNRYRARQMLLDRLEQQIRGKQSDEAQRIEKLRRQKRKRSKRAKEKMLAQKHERSQTKALRAPVRSGRDE